MDIDNTTLALLGIFLALMLWQRMKPKSLVHPLMLGKQAEPGPVRKTGESAIYRSWATGHNAPVSVPGFTFLSGLTDDSSNCAPPARSRPFLT